MVEPGVSAAGTPPSGGLFDLPLSVFRRIRHDAAWSLAGNLLTVLSGLATLKIIGRMVDAAEYGAASLVLGVCALLNQFIANPLLAERLRLYFDTMKQGQAQSLSRAVESLLLRTSTLIAVIYLAVAGVFYLRGQSVYLQLFLPVVALIYMQPQLAAAYNQLEAHRNYRGLSLVQPLATLLQVPILLSLLWMSVRGSVSVVLAQALAAVAVFAALQYRWRAARTPDPAGSTLGEASFSGFTSALYLFNLASWILGTSDRYLIDHFLTRPDVGIYVINYAFWAIPYTVLNGWINSFARPRLYARAADRAWDRVARVVLGTLSAGALIGCLGTAFIWFVGKPLALAILGPRYWHSEGLMMWLASAHVFFVIGHTASTYFLAIKRAHFVWVSCLLTAVGNITANIILLPRLGVMAAAITTFGAYVCWAVLMLLGIFVWSRKMRTA